MVKKRSFKTWSIIFGASFLLLLLAIAIYIPCPTASQFLIFRLVLALAAGAFAAVIPGNFNFTNKLVQATSGLGVFALVYLVNPATLITKDDCGGVKTFRGIVYIDNKEQAGVEIIVPSINRNTMTDGFGNFSIEYSDAMVRFPITVRLKFKTLIDTSFSVNEFTDYKEEYHFSTDNRVSSVSSLSGNSISFSNKDFNIIVSVINSNIPEMTGLPDSLQYMPALSGDVLSIVPKFTYFDLYFNQRSVKAGWGEMEEIFITPLPEFDIKVVNNSDEPVFLTEAILQVEESKKDDRAIVLFQNGQKEIYLNNAGWGNAENIEITYAIVPLKKKSSWNGQYDLSIKPGKLLSANINFDKAYYTLDLSKALQKKGVDVANLTRGYDIPNPTEAAAIRQLLAGDFDKGGIVFGKMKYNDEDGTQHTVKFEAEIDLWLEGGAAFESSATYNAALRAEGKNYMVSVPLSQAIKAKEFDRFFISMRAPQSSFHKYTLSLLYNDNEVFKIPVSFALQFFNTPQNSEFDKRTNKVNKRL